MNHGRQKLKAKGRGLKTISELATRCKRRQQTKFKLQLGESFKLCDQLSGSAIFSILFPANCCLRKIPHPFPLFSHFSTRIAYTPRISISSVWRGRYRVFAWRGGQIRWFAETGPVLNGKSISPKEPTELGQMSWKWSCSCPPMEQLLEALHSKSAHWGKNVALEVWYI